MALKSTIYKAALNVADLDRQVYGDFNLTIARHPSETDARMMLRVVAFALHAGDTLEFGRGISKEDEPDLWQKSLGGEIECWVDLGTPDESRLRKACGRSRQVVLYCYGDRAVPVWWEKNLKDLQRLRNLQVLQIADDTARRLADLAAPTMQLQCTIQDAGVLLTSGDGASLQFTPVKLL